MESSLKIYIFICGPHIQLHILPNAIFCYMKFDLLEPYDKWRGKPHDLTQKWSQISLFSPFLWLMLLFLV